MATVPVYEIYGMTETTAALTALFPEDHERALAGEEHLLLSAGRPILGTEVRIVDSIGDIHYRFVRDGTRIDKTVHYFLMEATGGDLADHDHEFEDVRWIDVAEAEELMRFPTERDILARALPVAGLA